MDLAKRFNYEATFPLQIIDPVSKEELGIRFDIRSNSSPEAKRVERQILDEGMQSTIQGKTPDSASTVANEIRKAASYVAGWDWGEHSYNGKKPECSPEMVSKVLDEQDWLFSQVVGAARKLANFTGQPATTVAKR